MPSLSAIMQGAEVTWGEQFDKGSLRAVPFWIHNVHETAYEDKDAGDGSMIALLVLDITMNDPSRKAPHAVITVGNTPERAPLLAYFRDPLASVNADGYTDPIGPVHVFEVPLAKGRTFWRIEDYDAEIVGPAAENLALQSGK